MIRKAEYEKFYWYYWYCLKSTIPRKANEFNLLGSIFANCVNLNNVSTKHTLDLIGFYSYSYTVKNETSNIDGKINIVIFFNMIQ